MSRLTPLIAALGLLLLAPMASAERSTTKHEGKPGQSCTAKDTKTLYTGKPMGISVTICWSGGGDPAMNGMEVIVDAEKGKQKLTWRQVLDVYEVKKVVQRKSPQDLVKLELRTLEHQMPNDDIVTKKVNFFVHLKLNKAGALSPTLEVIRL